MKDENNEPESLVPEPQKLLAALRADLPVRLSFEVRNPRAYAAIVAASETWPPIPEAYTRKLETTVYAVDTVTFTDGQGGKADIRGCVWSTDQGFMIKAPDGPKGQGVLSVGIWDETERERLHLAEFDARNRRLKMKKPRSLGRFGAATANESHVWLTDPKAKDTLELLREDKAITLVFGFPDESFKTIADQVKDWEPSPDDVLDRVCFEQVIGSSESTQAIQVCKVEGTLWGTSNGLMILSGKNGLRLDYRQSGPPENGASHIHLVKELHERNLRLGLSEPPGLGIVFDSESTLQEPKKRGRKPRTQVLPPEQYLHPTAKEPQAVIVALLSTSQGQQRGHSFYVNVRNLDRRVKIEPEEMEGVTDSSLELTCQKLVDTCGPLAVKAMLSMITYWAESTRGKRQDQWVEAHVADIARIAWSRPNAQDIKEIAKAICAVSSTWVEVVEGEWRTPKGGKPLFEETKRALKRVLNVESIEMQHTLFSDEPGFGEDTVYKVKFGLPSWLFDQLFGQNRQYLPTTTKVLRYDARREAPLLKLSFYWMPQLRINQKKGKGYEIVRTLDELAKESCWEPDKNRSRYIDNVKRFHERMVEDEILPGVRFEDPLESEPNVSPQQRWKGFRVIVPIGSPPQLPI